MSEGGGGGMGAQIAANASAQQHKEGSGDGGDSGSPLTSGMKSMPGANFAMSLFLFSRKI